MVIRWRGGKFGLFGILKFKTGHPIEDGTLDLLVVNKDNFYSINKCWKRIKSSIFQPFERNKETVYRFPYRKQLG